MIFGGWALGTDGPIADALLVVDGLRGKRIRLGLDRPQIAERHPDVPGAERSGWDAIVDLRWVEGPRAVVSLLAQTGAGQWLELDRSELDVEEPRPPSGGRQAAFTIVQNEPRFLPMWLAHYGRHFDPADLYVLDHESTDGSTEGLEGLCNVVPVHRDRSFDHMWLKGTVEDFQAFLLRSYEAVLFAEADEFVVPDPSRYSGLGDYIERLDGVATRCTGYNVVHYPDEPRLDFTAPVLRQRRYWHSSEWYSKQLLGRIPFSWNIGFHQEFNAPVAEPDPHLYLIHLHRVDYDYCLVRHRAASGRTWYEEDRRFNLGWHYRVVERNEFREWFFHGKDLEHAEREPIPERLRDAL